MIVETVDCDILVVRAGVSGMAGSMYAAAHGASVHVLEKGPTQGVHRLCVAGLNSKLAVAATGSTIDPKDFTQDFYRATGGFQTKMPVVSRYAKDSGKWIDWLVEAMTPYGWALLPPSNTRKQGSIWADYDTPHFFMGPNGENIMAGKTPNWMELFREIAEDKGATFHFDEPAVRLEREGEFSGRVTSVISQNLISGEYRRYKASKGILCAAGDMFNDKELVHKHCAFLEKCVSSIVEPNNTGDMHKAAMWVGAAMDDYSAGDLFGFQSVECKNYVGPKAGDEDYNPLLDTVRGTMWAPALSGYPVLWVDDGGRRFVDEAMNNFQQAGAQTIITTPTGKAWSVWDSAWESKFPADWRTNSPGGLLLGMMSVNTQGEIDREVEAGLIQKYDTIEDLIAGCGFEGDQFKETLDRYNGLCAKGYDEDCYKEARWLTSIDAPPFYAAHWGVMITSTRCGLKTDEHGRVIDTNSQVIPGLYAAGNNGGNFYGVSYPGTFGGTGIGHGQFYSWTAVRDMMGEDVINTSAE